MSPEENGELSSQGISFISGNIKDIMLHVWEEGSQWPECIIVCQLRPITAGELRLCIS